MADWAYFDRPATAVEENLAAMNGRADDFIKSANDTIEALKNIRFEPEPGAPTAALPDIVIPPGSQAPKPADMNLFGNVDALSIPTFEDLWAQLGFNLSDVDITIAPFESTVGAIVIPPAPAPLDTSGLPTAPVTGTVTQPVAPDPLMPVLDELTEIVVPDFIFPTLPIFDSAAPEFTADTPVTTLAFTEPVYASEVLDDVKASVRFMLAGGTGIPAAVQQALFERARASETLTAKAAVQDAFDTFASRNFSMPPGMLAAQVNAANEKAQLAANSLSRDILIKATDVEIENLRFAVQQGIAYETLLHNYVNNVAERSFQAAKAHVDADIALYNAQATIFNARTQAYQVAAQVFKIKVDAELSKLEVFKAEIQGELAKAQLNEQKVKVYQARLQAVGEVIDLYKAKMEGAKLQSELIRNQIESYKVSVDAYAAQIGAKKVVFEAYEAQVRAEGTKASALEAEARAYAATVQAQEARSNVKLKYIDSRIQAIRASLEKFADTLQANKEVVQASLEAIRARATAYTADVGRYSAEITGVTEAKRVALAISEARLRNMLAYFETITHEYDARMSRVLQEAGLSVEGLKAAGNITSTLGAGAMAAIHVGAQMSGSGSLSDTNSYSVSHNFQDS